MPYERMGRYFVIHLARVNACLTADRPETQFELLDMSDLTQGSYALPNGLRHHMFGAFADYIVDNILVWIRGEFVSPSWSAHFYASFSFHPQVIVFRTLVIEVDELVDPARFSEVRL